MSEDTERLSRERQIYDLLDRVVDLPAEEREKVLGDDEPTVADEVRAMMDPAEVGEGFLESPVTAVEETNQPTRIGPYRLIELIGEGGMGRVYLAEQEEPVRRRVALKILRFAADSPQARARFEAERHAMGRLDHPNVGKILEAGTTDDGLPFFAMELIQGAPITTYCDGGALSLQQRLKLFVDVCRGADHAHHKMLLHRDIKPSNVLVTEVDGRPMVKIIDFGIAKGLDRSLTDKPVISGGRLIGTPSYMSPEALGLGGDVGPRSDVFSLGILFYELLAGSSPWAGDSVDPTGVLKRRLTRPAARPSTRVTTLDTETLRTVARRRREDPRTLRKKLRRDLDWIAMKAISNRPEDRYGSAAELADDVERFLRDQPVSARPPSAGYVLRMLLRRHRLAVAAAAAVLAALALGTVGTTIGLIRAREEAEHARRARDETQEVVDFLIRTFQASGVESVTAIKPPAELTALELLDHGSKRIERELADQPLLRAQLEHTFGVVYRQLGLFESAQNHLESALLIRRNAPDVERLELADTHLQLALTQVRLTDPEGARGHLEQALALAAGDREEDLGMRADVLGALGRLERRQGNFETAEDLVLQALRIHEEHPGMDPHDHASTINNLAAIQFGQGRFAEAEARFREALEIYERVLEPGKGRARIAQLIDNIGAAIASQGRNDEAMPMFEQALAERRRYLGDDHPRLADSLNNIGATLLDLGESHRAEEAHREALAIREAALGPDHYRTALSLDNLARALDALGRSDEALPLQQRALAIREATYGADHPNVTRSLEHLASLAADRGDLAAARDLRARVLAIEEASNEPEDPRIGTAAVELGAVLWRMGEETEAWALFERGLGILEAGGDEAAEDLASAEALLAELGV
ncbi:MAG: tetratricopeptide repeat protein [bacterium]|nr:tetratricopeptide repeat protein [bacterium]